MSHAPQWKTRFETIEYGPYTINEMYAFISQGRVVGDTEVNHPDVTQGLWLSARLIKVLSDRLNTPTPPPVQNTPNSVYSAFAASTAHTHTSVPDHPTIARHSSRREAKRAAFKWTLLYIWGTWLGIFSLWFFKSMLVPLTYGSGDVVSLSSYVIATAIGFWAIATALPLLVISVVAYFFTHD